MNYKQVIQYLNFPDHHDTRHEWEYLMIYVNDPCYTIQDFANLITQYGMGIEELKLNLVSPNQGVIMFKKGGSIVEGFPGQITVAEYVEDTPAEEGA
jgi:hypothetical protein